MQVHFIGIGGIGVSALAQYYLKKGYKVSGSDLVSSEITDALKKLGAKIFIGHSRKCLTPGVKQVDLAIYSPAVPANNPELREARKLGIKIQSYPQALGELTKKYFTIAISGTHGKSTVTAMIGLILIKAGLDPTVIVGTKLKEFGNFTPYRTCLPRMSHRSGIVRGSGTWSNCRVGKSQYLVIEADEWQASFLRYFPRIIVLTNIEKEHLDFYKNLNNILKTFKKFISRLPDKGVVIANRDDQNIKRVLSNTFSTAVENMLWYSLKQGEVKKLKKVLKVPGEHNVYNALAALTLARVLKIPDKISFKTLSQYKGTWRRFELSHAELPRRRTFGSLRGRRGTPKQSFRGATGQAKGGTTRKITIISDYGHHPTEIMATLKAAREKFRKRKIWCIFQPHQYQRTFYLFQDFVKVFQNAPTDKLIITDIYDVAGREEKKIKNKISSEKLIKTINKPWAIYLKKEEIIKYLKGNLRGREVVIIMGAGDIYKLCEQF